MSLSEPIINNGLSRIFLRRNVDASADSMQQTSGHSGWDRYLREAGTLLVLVAIAWQSLVPLVAAARFSGTGPPSAAVLCTASGIATGPIEDGRSGNGPAQPGEHDSGSPECLLCCARIATAVLGTFARERLAQPFHPASYLPLAELLVGEPLIGSKGPRGPPPF